MGKLIINSLYGKLGSGIHNARYIVCYNSNELTELFNKYNILSITELNKIFIVEVHDNTIINGLNIGIAAAITSKARIKLLNTMIDVEKNGGRMLYCDTDSLFIEFEKEIYTGISK
jgi:DNA polymerase elongation subunit (family B)